jgi:hypothetical protein
MGASYWNRWVHVAAGPLLACAMAVVIANAEEPEALVTVDELLDPRGEYDPWKPGKFSADDLTKELMGPNNTGVTSSDLPISLCNWTNPTMRMPKPPPAPTLPSPWPAISSFALLGIFWMLIFVRRRQVTLRSIMVLVLGVAAVSAIFAEPFRSLVR